MTAPLAAEPAWLTPTLIAAYVALFGTLATIAFNGYRARRDRKRDVFAEALVPVVRYWEFPYVVRRRRHDDAPAERVRISEAMREVQGELAFHQAWIRIESSAVARAYDDLTAQTRVVMGSQIRDGWLSPPISDDTGMNISDVRRDNLDELSDAYTQAVRDHLSLWPAWILRAARSLA